MTDTGPGAVLGLGSVSGTTTGRTNSYVMRYSQVSYCPGPDVAYWFTAPTSRSYTFSVTTSSANLQFYMTSSSAQLCSGLITYQNSWWYNVPGSATVSMTAGQVIYLIVDGADASDSGPYTVTVT